MTAGTSNLCPAPGLASSVLPPLATPTEPSRPSLGPFRPLVRILYRLSAFFVQPPEYTPSHGPREQVVEFGVGYVSDSGTPPTYTHERSPPAYSPFSYVWIHDEPSLPSEMRLPPIPVERIHGPWDSAEAWDEFTAWRPWYLEEDGATVR